MMPKSAPFKHGNESYTWDELLAALDLLDKPAGPGQGYYVRSPLELAAASANKAQARNFSYDPVSQQLSWNPNWTPEQEALLGEQQEWPGVPNSGFYLNAPGGSVPVPVDRAHLERYLELDPEMQQKISSLTPEEFMKLRAMEGEGAPGVRDEAGPTPPGEPASGQSREDWLKDKRKELDKAFAGFKSQARMKASAIPAENPAAAVFGAGAEGMLGMGLEDPLEALNRLGRKGVIQRARMSLTGPDAQQWGLRLANLTSEEGVPPVETAPWEDLRADDPWAQPYLKSALEEYNKRMNAVSQDIAAERGWSLERANKYARQQARRRPTSGAAAGGMLPSTWG